MQNFFYVNRREIHRLYPKMYGKKLDGQMEKIWQSMTDSMQAGYYKMRYDSDLINLPIYKRQVIPADAPLIENSYLKFFKENYDKMR